MFTKRHQHNVIELILMKDYLKDLYAHLIIQALAVSMISVFVPIYLLKLGFTLKSVFIFLFIQWGTFGLFAPYAGVIIKKIGIKEVVLIRTPLFVTSLVSLSLMQKFSYLQENFLIVAFLLGFSSILYTLSITSLFAKLVHKKTRGYETSKFLSLPSLGTIIGPFIGATISVFFGFTTLFIIVSIILFISIFPIMFIKSNIVHPNFHFKDYIKSFSRYKNKIPSIIFYGLRAYVFVIVVPIAIYLGVNDILSLGLFLSTVSIIRILFTLFVGKSVDRRGERNVLKIGSILNTILLIILGMMVNSPNLIFIALSTGFITVLVTVPFESRLYRYSNRDRSPVPFLTFKETTLFMGRLILFITLIIFSNNLEIAFYLGALSSILSLI